MAADGCCGRIRSETALFNMSQQLERQLAQTLPPGMTIPEPLRQLFSWIEARGLYMDRKDGRVGFLHPPGGGSGGSAISFHAEGNADLRYWFGHDRPEVLNRLCVFANTGGDGSMAAFWLDEQGQQKIVHLGSGSGSTMVCVLAHDAVDFLRLLAIGYGELCWGDQFSEPPKADPDSDSTPVPNLEFQAWVRTTFGVDIPSKGSDIVAHPDDMDSAGSADPFNRWVAGSIA